MSESEIAKPTKNWFTRITSNPVTVKELRGRMRGRRAFIVMTVYLTMMSALVLLVYLAAAAASNNVIGPTSRQTGKAIFAAVLAVQIFLVIFIGPAFTSAAITGEKERQTYDLLRTTLLSARSFVWGKLMSALAYVLLLILVSIPIQSIAFFLGGIAPLELILSQLLIIVSALAYALLGLFLSAVMRSTLAATISTFAAALLLTFGGPFIAGMVAAVLSSFLGGPTAPTWAVEAFLLYGGLTLAATNLPATLVISDLFLVEEDALFYWTQVIDGHTVYLFSPWILYLILFLFLAGLLYKLTVRRVNRIADR